MTTDDTDGTDDLGTQPGDGILTLDDVASGRGTTRLQFSDGSVEIEYDLSVVTPEFRAAAYRLNRDGLKIEKRQAELLRRITTVEAEYGTPEEEEEDAAAEAAIQQILADDARVTYELREAFLAAVTRWGLVDETGAMIPLTHEGLSRVPAVFIGSVISAVLNASKLGEPAGAPSMKVLPSPSKPKATQATTRPTPTGMPYSKRASTARR